MRLAVARGLVLLAIAGAVSACGASNTVVGRTILDLQSATYNGDTNPFKTPGRWDLVYSWDCSEQRSQGHTAASHFGFSLLNADDMSLAAEDRAEVALSGPKGGGTIHYKRAGIYTISITSECSYRLRVLNPTA